MKVRLALIAALVLATATLLWLVTGTRREVTPPPHRNASSPTPAEASFPKLRELLPTLGPEEASRRIQALLDSGVDSATGLSFKVDRDGLLAEAPTLRVFLMDSLARVDRVAAGEHARRILKEMSSPEEWAVSLRNYARAFPTPEGNAFLEARMRQLLSHAPWQADPTTGYLESFDVAVYLGGTELVDDLGRLVKRRDNPAVAHAAFLSLDRLTLQEPAVMLEHLQRNEALLTGREETRANYFARASMLDSRQKAVLERYLLDPARGPAEVRAFAGLFPNANFMLSNNLLTRNETPSRDVLAQRDREALSTMEVWLRDDRFQKLRPELERIRGRLAGFLGAAGK